MHTPINLPNYQRPVTFGNAGAAAGLSKQMGSTTRFVEGAFHWLEANRTRQMLVEDFVGFGLLRTLIDLRRSKIYGSEELNWSVARERLLREVCSILTDNVSSGVVAAAAFGIAESRPNGLNAFTNRFNSFPVLELYQDMIKGSNSPEALVAKLTTRLSAQNQQRRPEIQSLLSNLAQEAAKLGQATTAPNHAEQLNKLYQRAGDVALEIAETLGLPELDVTLDAAGGKKTHFKLGDLTEGLVDVAERTEWYRGKTTAGQAWEVASKELLDNTLKWKRWKLPFLGVGVGLTMAVPYTIRWLTRKIDKIDYYPGEIGLKRAEHPAAAVDLAKADALTHHPWFSQSTAFAPFAQAQRQTLLQAGNRKPTWWEKAFPYVAEATQRGNLTPLLLTLSPLVPAMGLLDTVNRRFNNPLKPKEFLTKLRNLYDFGKGWPFTTQQQMASMFAFLIISRLSSARSGNEFRERLVDSFLGWGIWIFGTPLIKNGIATMLDASGKTNLRKIVDGRAQIRTATEIESLWRRAVSADQQALLKRTYKANIWLGAGSTLLSMFLLGIVEPYLAIRWTKHNSEKETQKIAQTQSAFQLTT